jgi:hypothetical protein
MKMILCENRRWDRDKELRNMPAEPETTIKVRPRSLEKIDRAAKTNGWTRKDAARIALHTFERVMAKLNEAPQVGTDEQKELFLRIAREIPGELMIVPPIETTYVDDVPVVRVNGWLFWQDVQTGDLLARELDGEGRFCRIVENQVQLLVSPQEAMAN